MHRALQHKAVQRLDLTKENFGSSNTACLHQKRSCVLLKFMDKETEVLLIAVRLLRTWLCASYFIVLGILCCILGCCLLGFGLVWFDFHSFFIFPFISGISESLQSKENVYLNKMLGTQHMPGHCGDHTVCGSGEGTSPFEMLVDNAFLGCGLHRDMGLAQDAGSLLYFKVLSCRRCFSVGGRS